MRQLDLTLPGGSYSILIGSNLLATQGEAIAKVLTGNQVAIVSDENVWPLYGNTLTTALEKMGITAFPLILPPGEASKSLDTLAKLYKGFYQQGLKRSHGIIALGGGVIGDIAGFAAATYMRGLPFIQIPTTLLAQVDSSVGGKVAVNLEEGKNLVGSFYQPRLVIADTDLLQTLPEREFKAALAEVVKYALIGCDPLLPLLSDLPTIKDNLPEIIYLCCKAKAAVVEKDERDTGQRMFLNYGHTFGHAIEKRFNYDRFNHGEAIAQGLVLAAVTGDLLGLTSHPLADEVKKLLSGIGLNYRLPCPIKEIIPLMAGDKKNTTAEINLVLLADWGQPLLYSISEEKLLSLLNC